MPRLDRDLLPPKGAAPSALIPSPSLALVCGSTHLRRVLMPEGLGAGSGGARRSGVRRREQFVVSSDFGRTGTFTSAITRRMAAPPRSRRWTMHGQGGGWRPTRHQALSDRSRWSSLAPLPLLAHSGSVLRRYRRSAERGGRAASALTTRLSDDFCRVERSTLARAIRPGLSRSHNTRRCHEVSDARLPR
jgi:hypothetical protein